MGLDALKRDDGKSSANVLDVLSADPAKLRASLEEADAATLMLVLVQITGDRSLLTRARPHISGPMNYHEKMPEDLRSEIRTRLADALLDHARTSKVLPPIPDGEVLREMLSIAVGEDVSADYVNTYFEVPWPKGQVNPILELKY
jgi:4-hydroxyacetophenone monooxygenase